jgi:hypothetical protein
LLTVAQCQLRFSEKRQTGLGRHHPIVGSSQQTGRKLAFQPANLLAKRRLAQLQITGSSADAAELDDPNKICQLA